MKDRGVSPLDGRLFESCQEPGVDNLDPLFDKPTGDCPAEQTQSDDSDRRAHGRLLLSGLIAVQLFVGRAVVRPVVFPTLA